MDFQHFSDPPPPFSGPLVILARRMARLLPKRHSIPNPGNANGRCSDSRGIVIGMNCMYWIPMDDCVGGGFKYFLNVHPYLGKIPILTNIFKGVDDCSWSVIGS